MIAKVAVAAANFAIDKPYSYFIPSQMSLAPGMRVTVPFGRSNRRTEGIVLSVEQGTQEKLKSVDQVLDEAPVLSDTMLRLAAFVRGRYFCTFYEAARAMLPAGLWFQTKQTFALTEDRSWQDSTLRQKDAQKLLQLLCDCGGSTDEQLLRQGVADEEDFRRAVAYLLKKKWITATQDFPERPVTGRKKSPHWRCRRSWPWNMLSPGRKAQPCSARCWSFCAA